MNSMRFKMVATYFCVILVILFVIGIFLMHTFRGRLYDVEYSTLFSKANIISEMISNDWDNMLYAEDLKFAEPVNSNLSGTDARCIITNTAYTVLYDSSEDSGIIGGMYVSDVIRDALEGRESSLVYDNESGIKYISVAVPVVHDGNIVGSTYIDKDITYIDGILGDIQFKLILLSIAVALLVGALSFGMSYLIIAPITAFTEVAREISKGNFKKRIDIKGYSEMEQMSKALKYMCDELELIEEKRRKFVSDASHELKTPMATIKLVCDSLASTPNPPVEMVQEFMNDLSNEIDRLTRIIEKLLTLTKFDNGKNPIKLELVDLQVLLERIATKLTPIAAAKKINIFTDFGEDALPPIMLDYDKITEAVYNIADNSINYSPPGSYVRISVTADSQNAVINIEDNGPGIPEEERDRIFERFYRLDDSRARDTGGTGLGLAIAKEAVQMHGGTIEVKNAVSGGSVFIITLPVEVKA